MRNRRLALGLVPLLWAMLLWGGCNKYYTASTDFNVTTGVADCKSLCTSWGMEMYGIVTMHDSNSGCICRTKEQSESARAPDGGSG